MAEALKTFREGEDILASETNENNQFLLSKLSDNAAQVQQYVEGEVATIKSNVSSVQATLQNNIDELANKVLVGVMTQGNTGSVKFTDSATKQSVIIQYGSVTGMGNGTTKVVELPVAFTSGTSYAVATSASYVQSAGDKGSSHYTTNHKSTSFTIGSRFEQYGGNTIWWIAIGH
jgi:hypothetical protein